MICQYKCKFYLNASHFILINNERGMPHSHCFEIVIDVADENIDQFMKFNDIEEKVEKLLAKYQGNLINEIEPFDALNPTLENICAYLGDLIFDELIKFGWLLLTIEISETPTRSYIINVAESKMQENSV